MLSSLHGCYKGLIMDTFIGSILSNPIHLSSHLNRFTVNNLKGIAFSNLL